MSMAWSSSNRSKALRLAGWLALPATLFAVLLLESKPPILCLWTRVFGVHCLGCGMHHAAFQLARGRFHDAWNSNPLVFPVLPLLAYLYVRRLTRLWRGFPAGS